jgi:hypothetical protein
LRDLLQEDRSLLLVQLNQVREDAGRADEPSILVPMLHAAFLRTPQA